MIYRLKNAILMLVLASLLAACSSDGSLPPSGSPAIPLPLSVTHAGSSTAEDCAWEPTRELRVSPTHLTLKVGARATFTACTRYFSVYTIDATPDGIVSVPSSVTPEQCRDDDDRAVAPSDGGDRNRGWCATITVTALAAGSAVITVTDRKHNRARVTVTVKPKRPSPLPGLTEYIVPTANSGLNSITLGPDGDVWFTEGNAGKIGRVTTSGVFTEYGGAAQPYGLAVGPDHNLWFNNHAAGPAGCGDLLGKFTIASRSITNFTLSNDYCLNVPVSGPDGNLWVPINADSTTIASVDVVKVNGTVIASYPIASNPYPIGNITFGPDGNFWIGEPADSKIAKMTPAGAVTEFPIASDPIDETSGPDGNVWFTEQGNYIGRITPSGVLSEFPVPTASSGLVFIRTGPDGNLWFTENAANQIGRITPRGKITEFGLTPSSEPLSITAGPDGDVWFTETGANKIAKFKP